MKLPNWLAGPEPANAPKSQLDTWDTPREDFAADARAEVSKPKGGAR